MNDENVMRLKYWKCILIQKPFEGAVQLLFNGSSSPRDDIYKERIMTRSPVTTTMLWVALPPVIYSLAAGADRTIENYSF